MASAQRFHIAWRTLGFHIACLTLAACATPEPPSEPEVAITVSHQDFVGPAATTASAALRVQVFALRTTPRGRSPEAAALAIAAEDGAPFRATPSLPLGSLWLDAADTAAWAATLGDASGDARRADQHLRRTDAVVVAGATTSIHTSLPDWPVLRILHDGERWRVRIDAPAPGNGFVHHVMLRDPLPADGACALFVPSPRPHLAGHALVVSVTGVADPTAVEAAFARARASAPSASPSAARQQAAIAASVVGGHNRRPALLAIARDLRLPASIDAILCADEPHLASITRAATASDPDDPARAWHFERAVWSALLPALQHDDLPPALRGCLLRHFGALGSDATTLQSLLDASRDATAFAAAVRQENEFALASRDVVQRVRGHDWLVARHAAVDDYEPTAPAAARRAALQRHAAAATGEER